MLGAVQFQVAMIGEMVLRSCAMLRHRSVSNVTHGHRSANASEHDRFGFSGSACQATTVVKDGGGKLPTMRTTPGNRTLRRLLTVVWFIMVWTNWATRSTLD